MAAGEGSTALSRNAMKTDLFQRFDARHFLFFCWKIPWGSEG